MIVYSYEYDASYIPAMPMVTIHIGKSDSTPSLVLSALVDSGADVTMIPVALLTHVNAIKRQRVFIRGISGKRTGTSLYTIALQVAHYERNRMNVVGNEETDDIILGRDILNHFVTTLDGLANAVEIKA